MIDAKFVPISEWPGTAAASYSQKVAPFRAPYARTLDLLETELGHLKAKEILIQAYLKREDIRNDGWPRSSARPFKPGVVLTFEVVKSDKRITMSFPCDRFNDWEDNLRAIAKSLEALRMVDRYGVTRNNEQYRGFAALPEADPASQRTSAIAFISRVTGWSESQVVNDPQGAYRLAARATHPDQGGSHEAFTQLQSHWKAFGAAV